jgi:hypothetical protein
LNCIDLVDRNLYERTCDVRWWATDKSFIEALQTAKQESFRHASSRMGVILNAYTVYHDLVLCDRNGIVVANGKPSQYSSLNRNESRSIWFNQASKRTAGCEFGFQSVHASPLVAQQPSLVYSCQVTSDGDPQGEYLGVLGVVFDWAKFADAILRKLPFDAVEADRTTAMIIDVDGSVLAASRQLPPNYRFPVQKYEKLMREPKGYVQDDLDGKNVCVAHATAPGFEGYTTGWHSIILQEL